MTIRVQLLVAQILVVVSLVFVSGVVISTYSEIQDQAEIRGDSRKIVRSVFSLALLGQEFGETPTSRIEDQWSSAYSTLNSVLSEIVVHRTDTGQQQTIARLAAGANRVAMLYKTLRTADTESQQVQIYSAALKDQYSIMVADAYLLSSLSDKIEQSQWNWLFLELTLPILALCLMAAVLFGLNRRVMSGLSQIQLGLKRYGIEEFERPIEVDNKDELSDLAERANEMARSLNRLGQEARANQTVIKAQVNQLRLVNEEVNNFAYVASHDLKSPLRGIEQLASWIAEDLGDTVDGVIRENLNLIQSRIRRLERLLDDLLAYSKAGRASGGTTKVDCEKLVHAILDLQLRPESIKLVLDGPLPVLYTYKVPLELVFRNLIGNAVKHHDLDQIAITISAEVGPAEIRFCITDDGPGIAQEHQQRVFGMFQTLKPRDEVEGSGMGLALVKKTVEAFGGTISLKSDNNRGCAFTFTWPVAVNPDQA